MPPSNFVATTGEQLNTPSQTIAHTVTAGANAAIYVFAASQLGTPGSVTGVTFDGLPLSFLASVITGGGDRRIELWRRTVSAAGGAFTQGASRNVVITWNIQHNNLTGCVVSATDVDQTTPEGTPITTANTNSPTSISVTNASGDVVLDGLISELAAAPFTVGANQSQLANFGTANAIIVSSTESTVGSVPMTWTFAGGSYWAAIGVSIHAVVSGVPAPTLVGVSAAIAVTATSAANITPAFPDGYTAVADDIAVILVHHSANGPFNTPTNYAIATDGIETLNDNNTVDQRVTVFWKRLVGGDTAQALVLTTNTVTTVRGAILCIIRGCRTTGTPFEVCKRLLNSAAATISFPAVTTTLDNALLLALGAYEDDPSARTTPTNWTAGAVFTSALGADMSLNYFTRVLAAAGTAIAFTTTVSTGTFANSVNVGAVLAFVPPLATPAFPSWDSLDAIPSRRSPVAVAF